jgi:hypothetical protein
MVGKTVSIEGCAMRPPNADDLCAMDLDVHTNKETIPWGNDSNYTHDQIVDSYIKMTGCIILLFQTPY